MSNAFTWEKAHPGAYYLYETVNGRRVSLGSAKHDGGATYRLNFSCGPHDLHTAICTSPRKAVEMMEREIKLLIPSATFTRKNF